MSNQGDIGVLDRTEMDHFSEIFVSLQKRAKSTDPDGMQVCPRYVTSLTPFYDRDTEVGRSPSAVDRTPRSRDGSR